MIDLFEIIKENSNIDSIDTMYRVLRYLISIYYNKQKERPENKWPMENKKLR